VHGRAEENRIKLIEENSDQLTYIEATIQEKDELINQLKSDLNDAQDRLQQVQTKCVSLELRCEELAIVSNGLPLRSASGASVVSPTDCPTTPPRTQSQHHSSSATVTDPGAAHAASSQSHALAQAAATIDELSERDISNRRRI
jgi:hypothetical protein